MRLSKVTVPLERKREACPPGSAFKETGETWSIFQKHECCSALSHLNSSCDTKA